MSLGEKISSVMRNKKIRYAAVASVVILLVMLAYRKPKVPVETTKVSKGIFTAYHEEEGITRVKEKFTVFSPVSGVLFRMKKHAGDTIKKGETITSVMMDYRRDIKSPATGTLLKVHRESEGPVEMGAPLFEVGNLKNLEIVSEILTKEATVIKAGNQVEITGWGGATISGKVRMVEPAAFTKISSLGVEEQRVRVLIDFIPPADIAEGYQVKCKIIYKTMPETLTLPVASLFREGEKWNVFVVQKNKAKKKTVFISQMSRTTAVVESGLLEGEEVILYPPETLNEGAKVH